MSLADEILWRPSPNFNARAVPIRFIILHYTGMKDGDDAVAWIDQPAIAGLRPIFMSRKTAASPRW